MKFLNIPLNSRILTVAEWPLFIPKEVPSIYKIDDGALLVCITPTSKYWVSPAESIYIDNMLQEEVIVESQITHAPNPQNSVSEKTLLMALAIAQRPELAKELLQ